MWGPCLFPGGLGAWGPSCRGASVQGLGSFFSNLGLEFGHELVKVFAAAHYLPALVDGVDIACQEASADLLPVRVKDAAVFVQVTLSLGGHFVVGSRDSVALSNRDQRRVLPLTL